MHKVTAFLGALFLSQLAVHAAEVLENADYVLTLQNDRRVVVENKGGKDGLAFSGDFIVQYSAKDPKLIRHSGHRNHMVGPRIALRWKTGNETIADVMEWVKRTDLERAIARRVEIRQVSGGGWEWIFTPTQSGAGVMKVVGPPARETSRPFVVGEVKRVQAGKVSLKGRRVEWSYPDSEKFSFSATLELPEGRGDPKIRYTITPKTDGFFSVSYMGAPESPLSETLPVPQETETRAHRQFNYVIAERDLRLPRIQVARKNDSWALAVGAEECRFRLPDIADSRFGTFIIMENKLLRPVLMAPLFGGTESRIKKGEPWSFTFHVVKKNGTWREVFSHIAYALHGFRDMRDNRGPGSINTAIERIMAFIANHNGKNYSAWDEQQKYHDYFVDKTGVFKPFSPLYSLSAGIITDDADFFHRRGLRMLEFSISRPYNVFGPYDTSDNKQANSAVRNVGKPYLGYAQLIALHELLQKKTPALKTLADEAGKSGRVSELLAESRITGNKSLVEQAKIRARKLSLAQEDDLFEALDLAMATKDPADIDRAVESAYANISVRISVFPMPPDALVTVEKGGRAPVHPHSFGRHRNQWGFPPPVGIPLPEAKVEAWRIARVGIPALAYPMEFWMNLEGGFMRAASLGNDKFLRDIARWGMVGRFGTFPGDNRSIASRVPEENVVDSPPWMWNYATVNPGHAWDFVSELMDFLVSDAYQRSVQAIDFPAVSAQGTGFRTRIYGAYPGEFYGDKGVYLWLPRGVVTIDNKQIDWIAGWREGQMYLALINQSFEDEPVNITLSKDRVLCENATTRVWRNNKPDDGIVIKDNRLKIIVPAKGITAFAIPAKVTTRLQAKLYDPNTAPMGENSFKRAETPFGKVHAMLMKSGGESTGAFIYTEALPEKVISARLRWKQGDGEWREKIDAIYPYEFSPLLKQNGGPLVCVLEVERENQQVQTSPVIVLSETDQPANATAPVSKPFPPLEPDTVELCDSSHLDNDFVDYLKAAANWDNYGMRNGRYYPYSTPLGRRIAWKQNVWDKKLFETGVSPEEADKRFRSQIVMAEERVAAQIGPGKFSSLDKKQREILVDIALTENVIPPALLAQCWKTTGNAWPTNTPTSATSATPPTTTETVTSPNAGPFPNKPTPARQVAAF